MMRGLARLFLSFGYVTSSLFLIATESAEAQARSSAQGIEIHDFSWPFPERVIKRSHSRAAVAAKSLATTNTPLDAFQRVAESTTGEKRFLIVLADVIAVNNDGSTRLFPSPLRTAAEVKEIMEGTHSSVKSVLDKASWGQLSINGDVTGDGEIDVFGPITLTIRSNQASDTKGPAPDLAGGDQTTEGDLCESLPSKYNFNDAEMGLDPNQLSLFDASLTLVANTARKYFNCPWYAVTDLGESSIVASLEDPSASDRDKDANARAITHEIGHLLGLDHSHGHAVEYVGPDAARKEAAREYGDITCMMGFGAYTEAPYFNIPQSFRLGWLPKSSAIEITEAGSYTVTLDTPAQGPQAALPSSLWIDLGSSAACNVPGFLVVSSGTGGSMVSRLQAIQQIMYGPITKRATSIDYGLTVHSVPRAADNFDICDNFGRSEDGAPYLEGIVEPTKSLNVPNLGVTVKMLSREGEHSIVQVDVADMHRLFTKQVEKTVPGTRHALKLIAHLQDQGDISDHTLKGVRKLSRLFQRSKKMLNSEEGLAAQCYSAGIKVTALVTSIERAARKALRANGQHRTNLVHLLLKPLARRYLAA